MELSLPGTFAPGSESDVELSLPGTFVHGTFVPTVSVTWFRSPTQIMII